MVIDLQTIAATVPAYIVDVYIYTRMCLFRGRVPVSGPLSFLREVYLMASGPKFFPWSLIPCPFWGHGVPPVLEREVKPPPHFLSGQNMPLAVTQDFVV